MITSRVGSITFHDLAVYLSAAILPMYLSMFRFPVGGFYIRAADFIFVALLLLCLIFFRAAYSRLLSPLTLSIMPLFIYMVFQGFALDNLANNIKEMVQILGVILFLSLTSFFLEREPHKFLRWLTLFMAVSAIYTTIYHMSIGHYIGYKLANNGRYAFGFLAILLFVRCIFNSWSLNSVVPFGASVVLLLVSMERKGLLGLIVVVFCYFIIRIFGFIQIRVSFLLAMMLTVIVIAILWGDKFLLYFDSLIYLDNFIDEAKAVYTSNIHRKSLIVNGLDIFFSNVFFGVGADNIKYAMYDYYLDPRLANGTHNFYLDSLIKYGVVGALLMLLPMFTHMKRASSDWFLLIAIYCYMTVFFMVDGQSSLILFFLPVYWGRLMSSLYSKNLNLPLANNTYSTR